MDVVRSARKFIVCEAKRIAGRATRQGRLIWRRETAPAVARQGEKFELFL
jgi:hypothetical protein